MHETYYRPDRDRRVASGLGSGIRTSASGRRLDSKFIPPLLKLPRTPRNSFSVEILPTRHKGQVNSDFVGQHHCPSVRTAYGRPKCPSDQYSTRNLVPSDGEWNLSKLQAHCRQGQLFSGPSVKTARQVRLAVTSQSIFISRPCVGSSHDRPIRKLSEPSVAAIQQPLCGSAYNRYRRFSANRLVQPQQFCKRAILPSSPGARHCLSTTRDSHNHSPVLAGPTLPVAAQTSVNSRTTPPPIKPTPLSSAGGPARTASKPLLAHLRVESSWERRLALEGWSDRARRQFTFAWAESTLHTYNNAIAKLKKFCEDRGITFPPDSPALLADFLCMLCDSSGKPRSALRNAQAAVSHLYVSLNFPDLTKRSSIALLMTALIKSGTRDPLLHTPVMPVNVFAELFYSWPENDLLCIKQLRLKTIVLLSLSLMLRPSDIAPKAVVFDAANMSSPRSKAIFSAKHVKFLEDGSASITLVGTKNDLQRSGFECHLPNHANSLVDPVGALRHYMSRTETIRNNIPQKPVFITLRPPFKHLEASGIAKVLEEGIHLAGLGGKGFSAKSFSPNWCYGCCRHGR